MSSSSANTVFRVAVLGVVKHDYVPLGLATHPRFDPVVVADDASQPEWVHERNQKLADELNIPYVRGVEAALRDYDVQVACVSPEAERHADLSVRAANAGLHVVQDKPMSTLVSECDRVVEAVERNGVQFMMWNRNMMPAMLQARRELESGAIGQIRAVHIDFYFAKDAGPRRGEGPPDSPKIDWLEALKAAHVDGSDGGVGHAPMGELQIEGIYPLSHIRTLTGARIHRVFARTTAHFHQRNVDHGIDDLASVTLEMEHGIVGTLCIGRIGRAKHENDGEIKIHIVGTTGAMVINEPRPEVRVFYRGRTASDSPARRVGGDADWLLMENFAHAIETNGDTILNARVGRDIAATAQAAIDSGRSGRPVEVT